MVLYYKRIYLYLILQFFLSVFENVGRANKKIITGCTRPAEKKILIEFNTVSPSHLGLGCLILDTTEIWEVEKCYGHVL